MNKEQKQLTRLIGVNDRINTVIPFIHPKCGCTLEYKDIKEKCQKCQQYGPFRFDTIHYYAEQMWPSKQLVEFNGQVFDTSKSKYSMSTLSKDPKVKESQDFILGVLQQEKVSSDKINQIAQINNLELIKLVKQISQTKRLLMDPVIGLINESLCVLFPKLKLSIQLTIKIQRKKIQTLLKGSNGKIIQILMYGKYIYALHQVNQYVQLYSGEVSQIYEDNGFFLLTQMVSYALQAPAKLAIIDNTIMFISKEGTITDLNNQDPQINQQRQYTHLSENSHVCSFDNHTILISGRLAFQYVIKQQVLELVNALDIQEMNNITLIPTQNISRAFDISQLCQNQVMVMPIDNQFNSIRFNVTNHQSYMKTRSIPTTYFTQQSISCCLIGLELGDILLPAILVCDCQRGTFEVELL